METIPTYQGGVVFPPDRKEDCVCPPLPENLLEYVLCQSLAEYYALPKKDPETIYLIRDDEGEAHDEMFLGGVRITSAFLGEDEIGTAYLGEYLVFEKTPAPYLEIAPEMIWVYTDWSAYNDVYSNTTWNVN